MMVAVVVVMVVVVASNVYVNNAYNVPSTIPSALCTQPSHKLCEEGAIIIVTL